GWTLPKGVCDTHAHVFGPPHLFPYADTRRYTPPAAPVEHYRNMQKITGLSRVVFVCPTAHGHDNRVILDAVAKLGDSARGLADEAGIHKPCHDLGINALILQHILSGAIGALGQDVQNALFRRVMCRVRLDDHPRYSEWTNRSPPAPAAPTTSSASTTCATT